MIVWRVIICLTILVCGASCKCKSFFDPYDTMYYCDNLNDVPQIQNKSLVKHITVSNASDVLFCDFPLLDGFENL